MAGPPAGSGFTRGRPGESLFPTVTTAPAKPVVLSSKWTGLSEHLLATIYPVTPQGARDTSAGAGADVAEALVAAAQRGVAVRVVVAKRMP